MDEAHTYFVGDGQWLVHNCPPYSLSNLKADTNLNLEFNQSSLLSIQPNVEYYKSEIVATAGWTGAYDFETGKFIALPSDPTMTFLRGQGITPSTIVPRQGGHGSAQAELVRQLQKLGINLPSPLGGKQLGLTLSQRMVGFHLQYPSENMLSIGWKSNTLNIHDSKYAGNGLVYPQYHEQIIEKIVNVIPSTFAINPLR